MRRVNIRNGLKQRLNEILGTDYGSEGNVAGLTSWSIQAAMIMNMRRIVKGLVGDISSGRVLKGLWISDSGSLFISPGIGMTQNGDIVVVESSLPLTIATPPTDGYKYIYLKHILDVLDGTTNTDGKKTGFIAKAGTENIVYDDLAASKKDTVGSFVDLIIVQENSENTTNKDLVYLGKIHYTGGAKDDVINSYDRGLPPNDPTDPNTLRIQKIVCENATVTNALLCNTIDGGDAAVVFPSDIEVSQNASIGGDLTVGGDIIVDYEIAGITQLVTFQDGVANIHTLTFTKGILTDYETHVMP